MSSNARSTMVVAAALAALAVTAACGSDDAARKRQAWAKQVCTPEVVTAIDQSAAALADVTTVRPGETPVQVRDRLAADVAKAAAAHGVLATALDRAGDPHVKNGESLRAQAVGEQRAAAADWSGIQAKINALPITAQNTFAAALGALAPEIDKVGQNSQLALRKLHGGALGKALAKVPGCAPSAPKPSAGPSGSTSPVPSTTVPASSAVPSAGTTRPAGSGSPSPAATSGTASPTSAPPSAAASATVPTSTSHPITPHPITASPLRS